MGRFRVAVVVAMLLVSACGQPGQPSPTAPRAAPLATATAPPSPTAAASPTVTGPAATPTPVTYTVQAGDTLANIAARFGTSVEALAQANQIANVNLIRIGQVLVIPPVAPAPKPTATP